MVDRRAHPDLAVRSVVGELADPGVIADALGGGDVAGVVHLAALTSVLRSVEHPVATPLVYGMRYVRVMVGTWPR